MESGGRMLLIVDPQIDFITGTLPVPGAVEAMNALAEYVKAKGAEYQMLVITCDRHSLRHCSFRDFGGEWPPHCVESSVGAAVWPPLMEALYPLSDQVRFLYKGEDTDTDEYSIFRCATGRKSMEILLRRGDVSEVDICGLAGDVCVVATLGNLRELYPEIPVHLLTDFSPCLGKGQ